MNLVVQLQDFCLSVMEGKWIILKAQICSSKKDNSSITGEDLSCICLCCFICGIVWEQKAQMCRDGSVVKQ